jgi:hypothetical protein
MHSASTTPPTSCETTLTLPLDAYYDILRTHSYDPLSMDTHMPEERLVHHDPMGLARPYLVGATVQCYHYRYE